MAVSKAFTTVTPFSKLVALILFIILPFVGFYLGMEYQKSITPQYPPLQYDPSLLTRPAPKVSPPMPVTPGVIMPEGKPKSIHPAPPQGQTLCTMDARQCPDGSWVGRSGPNCEFVCK